MGHTLSLFDLFPEGTDLGGIMFNAFNKVKYPSDFIT